jgi:DNA polymerase (family 10)
MKLPLSSTISNSDLAEVFSFIGQVIGLEPNGRFRARAYDEAGVIIRQLNYQLTEKYEELQKKSPATADQEFAQLLDDLPGIGEAITAKILELVTTGDILPFQKYVADLPAGIYPLVQLYGIGIKKAAKLAEQFHLNDAATALDKLLTEAKQGNVRTMEGFGEKKRTRTH